MKEDKDIPEHEHRHLGNPEIECEKCGGEVKAVNTNPRVYECTYKKCNHKFNWIEREEVDLR